MTAIRFINVENLFFLRKVIGPKNSIFSARFAYFVFLRRSAKNMAAKCKGRAKINKPFTPSQPRKMRNDTIGMACGEKIDGGSDKYEVGWRRVCKGVNGLQLSSGKVLRMTLEA